MTKTRPNLTGRRDWKLTDNFKKIIVSGNILEVFTYQKEPTGRDHSKEKIDAYNALDLENTSFEMITEDRTLERRLQSTREARNLTRRLALMNFNNEDKFITLTYKDNMRDLGKADKDFKDFVKRFKYQMGMDQLKYLAVRERQKRGAIHYHMLCDWKQEMKTEEEIRHFERVLGTGNWGVGIWRGGFVDIKPIDHVDNVGAYIIKYMTKNLSIELYKGKKLYLCSQGLERPKEYKGIEAEVLFATYNLGHKKEVFTNHYESEYLGTITYHEYNLSRDTQLQLSPDAQQAIFR